MDDQPVAREQKSINFRVHALSSSLFRLSKQYFGAKFGLGVPEMRILSNLDAEGQLTASQLVFLTAMDKALVSRILTSLHRRGSIETCAGLSPKRPTWVLSAEGRELVDELRPLWRQREALIQKVLTLAEQEQLKEMLLRLFVASEALRLQEISRTQDAPAVSPKPRKAAGRKA